MALQNTISHSYIFAYLSKFCTLKGKIEVEKTILDTDICKTMYSNYLRHLFLLHYQSLVVKEYIYIYI